MPPPVTRERGIGTSGVDQLNDRVTRHLGASRRALFEDPERPEPLPQAPYVFAETGAVHEAVSPVAGRTIRRSCELPSKGTRIGVRLASSPDHS